MEKIAVSACLLGHNCKYNGGNNYCEKVVNLKNYYKIITICPESFGGLPIPRMPSEIRNGKVYSKEGVDVTDYFIKGTNKTIEIIEKENIKYAILKANSPSCGVKHIYDGTFTGTKIEGMGVCAKVLKEKGLTLFDEKDDLNILINKETIC